MHFSPPPHMDCHIEIFHEGQWLEAAQVSFSDVVRNGFRADDCVFEYDLNYAFSDVPPVSLAFPLSADRQGMQAWPAFLYDLVPQGNGRRFLLGRMQLPDAQASDLPLLCAGAFNPIGRLRIREAVTYFAAHRERHELVNRGFDFDELLARAPEFHETMMVHGMLAAGGTGVQGVAPKYLLTQAQDGKWFPDAALPDDRARRHFIVKRPRGASEADRKVLRNEEGYMQVARRMGLRTAELPSLHGDMLFIPRFDRQARDGRVLRHHQESAASIAGLTGFGAQADQFKLLAAIRAVVDDPIADTIEFIQRDVLNLAMRNPDNHARNTAVQILDGAISITPLFDFAPMYLDPEGITRAARWYHSENGKELQRWDDVLAHLALPTLQHERLVEALLEFGAQLVALPATMREAGIDEDIVDFVTPSIDAQRIQLLTLRP
ncbi:type II toxin-antitoxin system HipA family toxin [Massilia forsythiae]|nr:HipA domain-containing protein [Massilia forsythiae]